MLVKLQNPMVLGKVVEIISEIVSDVRIRVTEFGMSITAMDPANVSMLNFRIPKSSFSQFETGNEVLGVNLDNFKQVLKRAGAGSSLIIEKKANMLNIQIQDRIRRNFTLNLIDIEGEEIDFDEKTSRMNFTATVEINSVDLMASVEDCAVVSDAATFSVKDGKFVIEAKSMNSAMSEFSSDEVKIQATDCKSKYSLEYMQKFMKGAKLCEKTILQFSDDHPLKMDFKNPEMELSFVLAPRVENED
ncbi:hypothetical protein HYT24_00585 [Candidatus Pacearchaeota archaeon]|nr:hypothetical protein [Candidatus Pacearchaeota archaeon]